MKIKSYHFLFALLLLAGVNHAPAQGTAFSYQGRLSNANAPANGIYDVTFTLYATNVTGSAVSAPVTNTAVAVTNGLFTTLVDFGSAFTVSSNWLEIAVSTNGANSFTTLAPRQQLTPVPYAIYSENAGSALLATTAASASSVASSNLTGTITLAQLPSVLVTNNPANLTVGAGNGVAPFTVPLSLPASAVGSVSLGGSPFSVAVAGRYAYVGNDVLGTLQVVDVSIPSAPVLVGSANLGNEPWSVAVGGRYAYVINQNSGSGQLQVVDVSTPSNPVLIATLSVGGDPHSLALAGRYVYVGNGSSALLQVVDVSIPSSPVIVGSIPSGSYTSATVAVAGRYAYVANYLAPSLQVVDVSVPSAPAIAGTVTTGDGPEFSAVSGRYAYVGNYNATNFQVIDISNPASPSIVGTAPTAGKPLYVAMAGRYAFVTMALPYLIQVFDVGAPSNPTSIGTITMPGGTFDAWAIAVSGRYLYAVNGSAKTLQVFDFGGAFIQPMEVGSLETGTLQTRDTATVGNNLDVRGGLTVSASARISGGLSVDNGTYLGNGGGLTNLAAANLTGTIGATQLPANVALLNASQTFTGQNQFTNFVGLGTTSPDRPLSIQGAGTVGEWISLKDTNGATKWHLNNTGGGLNFVQSYVADFRLFISTNGNVGIGTGTPSQLLVVGTGGAYCNGTTWVNGSDRNTKQAFDVINPREVLAKVSAMPITEWQYKVEADGTKHIGPMAQDFHAAFGLNGADDKHISTVDEGGVALAAIQGLNQKLNEKDAEIQALEKKLDELQAMVKQLAAQK